MHFCTMFVVDCELFLTLIFHMLGTQLYPDKWHACAHSFASFILTFTPSAGQPVRLTFVLTYPCPPFSSLSQLLPTPSISSNR